MRFLNVGHNAETVARFAHAVNGRHVADAAELGPAYRRALAGLRPYAPPGSGVDISHEDGKWADHCRSSGILEDVFAAPRATDGPTRKMYEAHVHEAFAHVRSLDPNLHRIIELLVTDIVLLDSGVGGGSVNTLPGVIVMSPGEAWDVPRYAECLVHEAMHTALFVTDTVYGLFSLTSRELEDERYHALSAVKVGEMRPLDRAFHAAGVALPLMYLQHLRGVTPLDSYTESFREVCRSLGRVREHFSDYGRLLLDEMTRWADAEPLDFDHLAHAISSMEYANYRPVAA
ncbi:hypothetical protein B4N89_36090 [Embleya scabrispora]|uniref:HEXXH motif domain-containing protein n=1 Tax=Embleya scabrispora TaxID=159449 RepID=A0A1T3NM02_9ACTN|nr:HEXXH motif-containing putative peptide modification protein [Embleya scabrispora]OPC77718.1 hypothetical protein B4N89_36090 [Embleya scabrispora]